MANDRQWKIILSLVLLLGPIGYKCCSPNPEESSNAGGGNDGGGNGGNGNGGNGNGTGGNDDGTSACKNDPITETTTPPTFTWDSKVNPSGNMSEPFHLNIDFNDGKNPDVAVLKS